MRLPRIIAWEERNLVGFGAMPPWVYGGLAIGFTEKMLFPREFISMKSPGARQSFSRILRGTVIRPLEVSMAIDIIHSVINNVACT